MPDTIGVRYVFGPQAKSIIYTVFRTSNYLKSMKDGPKFYSSWDTVIFFLITVVGFVFSVQRIMYPQHQAIASIPTTLSNGQGGSISETIDLGCLDKNPTFSPIANAQGRLRLKGRICHGEDGPRVLQDVTVKNVANGREATVFQSVRFSFSTDALILDRGSNIVEVSWRESGDSNKSTLQLQIFQQ